MTPPALPALVFGLSPVATTWLAILILFLVGCVLLIPVCYALDEYLRYLLGRPK